MGSWLTLQGCRCSVSPPCGILAGLSDSCSPEQPVLVTYSQRHLDGEFTVSWRSLRVGSLCLVPWQCSRSFCLVPWQGSHSLSLHHLLQEVRSPQHPAEECSGETEPRFCQLGIYSSGAAGTLRGPWDEPAVPRNLGGC